MYRPVSLNAASVQHSGLYTMKKPSTTLVNEFACADSIGMSVHFLRKDRIGKQIVPFTKIGGAVRYDLAAVRDAIKARTQGGSKK